MEQRDNGLSAESWLPLADVEAALTDHVLTALAEGGIAAYAESATTGPQSFLGAATLSAGPSDRISVDGTRRREARVLLDNLLPELRDELTRARQSSEDEAWTEIVATLERPGDGNAIRWPSAKDVTNEEPAPLPVQRSDDDEWSEDRVEEFPNELMDFDGDDEEFVPPEAPPVPKADAITRLAWIGLVGGPLFLFLGTFMDWDIESMAGLLAVGAFVGGFVTLVARMNDRPPLDESDDDGARI